MFRVRPISLLKLSLLTLLDSNFPVNPLWAWEFYPLHLRSCVPAAGPGPRAHGGRGAARGDRARARRSRQDRQGRITLLTVHLCVSVQYTYITCIPHIML